MRRFVIAAAALAFATGCPEKKEEYPNPTPGGQAPAAAPSGETAAAPAPAPAPAPGAAPGAPAAAPGAAPAAPGAPGAAPAQPGTAVQITPAATAEADQIFSTLCSTCHGPAGQGDGPAAAAFPVKPRNFHDATWQSSVTDEHIEKTILQGGAAVGKSPLMPPNPQLSGKPEVVAALRAKIRAFGKAQ